ncbi:MAG: hypothetical protein ICV77_04055 [Cyanobacteria bacterium Co-bin8]|nr:hypothetical protein [Cyanobacteria bacterium Co-bin8]
MSWFQLRKRTLAQQYGLFPNLTKTLQFIFSDCSHQLDQTLQIASSD